MFWWLTHLFSLLTSLFLNTGVIKFIVLDSKKTINAWCYETFPTQKERPENDNRTRMGEG